MGGRGWPNADVADMVGGGGQMLTWDKKRKKINNIHFAIEMLWGSTTFPWFTYEVKKDPEKYWNQLKGKLKHLKIGLIEKKKYQMALINT